MHSDTLWLKVLLGASIGCAIAVAGLIIWSEPRQPSGVLAILASIPFLVLARFAWSRLHRGSGQD